MDLKTAKDLAERYLGPTVIVILTLGTMLTGGMVYVWNEHKDVVRQEKQFANERQTFNNERLTAEIALAKREGELDKREYIVQQQEKDYQERLSSFQQKLAEHGAASVKLKQEQATLSEAQRSRDAEEKIQRLMSEFSALGVDLQHKPCHKAETAPRYNAAAAKYSEINTLINRFKLESRYDTFLKLTPYGRTRALARRTPSCSHYVSDHGVNSLKINRLIS
jgi:hypothetical protein